jgi:hypothetical protein
MNPAAPVTNDFGIWRRQGNIWPVGSQKETEQRDEADLNTVLEFNPKSEVRNPKLEDRRDAFPLIACLRCFPIVRAVAPIM